MPPWAPMQVEPPTPDVDPENVEFVIFVRATKVHTRNGSGHGSGQSQQRPHDSAC